MITLFEEDEQKFTSLGLGILKDATDCSVSEGLNDEFELTMDYPLNGANYSKIRIGRIIFCKPNPFESSQPFRIYNISKPINGVVTISAEHISYDMNGIIVAALSATNCVAAVTSIQNNIKGTTSPFKITTDIVSSKSFKTTTPYSMRTLLMGSGDDSLLNTYEGEIKFDKFNAKVLKRRGEDRGVEVRYAKNMTDLKQELSDETLYNGVYPYYHKESTTTSTSTTESFTKVYIVGSKPFQSGWLSFTKDGEPYTPIDSTPVQIETEGDYEGKVYCWNANTDKYDEKLYNQQVTLIEGVIEPDWISIDWSTIPTITVKAGHDGYFKTATEDSWTKRASGDTVYSGSIMNASTLAATIIYYSEVIPSASSSTSSETTSVTHIELDDPVIWIDKADAKSMKHNKILALDLTDQFDDNETDSTSTSDTTDDTSSDSSNTSSKSSSTTNGVTQNALKLKAIAYIKEHNIGDIKKTTTVSFVDLASTTEADQYKNLEKVLLGDTVRIIYEDLGVDDELRVITTEYDVLKGKYSSIELGTKESTLSGSTIQNGDNISQLTNDEGYADTATVSALIADTVTARYIEARNAKLTKAQIDQLSVERINCSGVIEASQLSIDKLVAKLLVADNAEISEVLTAGSIKVKGNIDITSGSIAIKDTKSGTVFNVDSKGNVTANSVAITGGTLNIGEGAFEVTNEGVLSAKGADIEGSIAITSGSITIGKTFKVTDEGVLTATDATINGTIKATDGIIGGFTLDDSEMYNGNIGEANYVMISPNYFYTMKTLSSDPQNWVFLAGQKFGITNTGKLYATDAIISGDITITSGKITLGTTFSVTKDGALTATSGTIGGFNITDTKLYYGNSIGGSNSLFLVPKGTDSTAIITLDGDSHQWVLTAGKYFGITTDGNLYASDAMFSNVAITSGSITIGSTFSVDKYGKLTATSGIIGGFTIGTNSIYNGINSLESTSTSGIYLGIDGIRLGSRFKILKDGSLISSTSSSLSTGIDTDGKLTAAGANISGNIKITSGSISIKSSDDTVTFQVTKDGNLTATSANITGILNASSGSKIGGFSITDTDIYNRTIGNSSFVMMSTGHAINNVISITYLDGSSEYVAGTWAFMAGNKLGITTGGVLYAQDVWLSGTVIANTGRIGRLWMERNSDGTSQTYALTSRFDSASSKYFALYINDAGLTSSCFYVEHMLNSSSSSNKDIITYDSIAGRFTNYYYKNSAWYGIGGLSLRNLSGLSYFSIDDIPLSNSYSGSHTIPLPGDYTYTYKVKIIHFNCVIASGDTWKSFDLKSYNTNDDGYGRNVIKIITATVTPFAESKDQGLSGSEGAVFIWWDKSAVNESTDARTLYIGNDSGYQRHFEVIAYCVVGTEST